MKKFFIIRSLTLCTIFLSSVLFAGNELKIGMELSYPPFEMTDKHGKPDGISVGIAEALGNELGRPVVIKNIPFDGLIPALKTGSIDLIISSLTVNDERKKSIDFSDPYVKTGLALLININAKIKDENDLNKKGVRIAVKKGTTAHAWAVKNAPKAKILTLDKDATAVLEVVQGKADAFIYDQMSVYKYWIKNRQTTKAVLKAFQQESWAVGVRKGNDELLKKVNTFIHDFGMRKGFDNLGTKYLGEEKKTFQKLGVDFIL